MTSKKCTWELIIQPVCTPKFQFYNVKNAIKKRYVFLLKWNGLPDPQGGLKVKSVRMS